MTWSGQNQIATNCPSSFYGDVCFYCDLCNMTLTNPKEEIYEMLVFLLR